MSLFDSLLGKYQSWITKEDLLQDRGEIYALKMFDQYFTGNMNGDIPEVSSDIKFAFRMTMEDAKMKRMSDRMLQDFVVTLIGPPQC
jgi:hypothetical protein